MPDQPPKFAGLPVAITELDEGIYSVEAEGVLLICQAHETTTARGFKVDIYNDEEARTRYLGFTRTLNGVAKLLRVAIWQRRYPTAIERVMSAERGEMP